MRAPKGYLEKRARATKAEVRRAFDEAATKAIEAGVPFVAVTVDTAVHRNTQYVFDGAEGLTECIENTIEMGASALMACLRKVPGEMLGEFVDTLAQRALAKEHERRGGTEGAS